MNYVIPYGKHNINQKDIEVASVVDYIEGYEKELIITDRRIFLDDRKLTSDINYGMAVLTRK